MTPVDRMIRTRQQQRDEAARELAAARERLRELEAERAALTERCRAELEGAVGTETLSLAALETMDASRRWTELATERSAVAVEEARRVTTELHRLLRQLEILRERAAERERVEEGRRERHLLDELAARRARGRLLCLVPLVLALGHGNLGCKGKEEAAAVDAGAPDASDAGDLLAPRPASSQPSSQPSSRPASRPVSDAGVKGDAMTFSLSELHELSALRARARQLAKQERELAAREQRLATALAQKPRATSGGAPATPTSQPAREARALELVDLIQVLERMPVRSAAAMLAEMDPGLVAAALRRLPAKRVAMVLAQMPPDKAGPVAARLDPKREPVESDGSAESASPKRPGQGTPRPGQPKSERQGDAAVNTTSK